MAPSPRKRVRAAAPRVRRGDVPTPLIALLTDFGDDYYVGVLKAVIATRAPRARTIDLTHRIRPGAVAEAAYVLASAEPDFPPHTVFCCVVDPGVGGARRRIVARTTRGARFAAPDNGLLTAVLDADPEAETRRLDRAAWALGAPSATFQGRTHFAPAAAALAAGARFEDAGPRIDDAVRLDLPAARRSREGLRAAVVYVDGFGNLVTSADGAALEALGPPEDLEIAFPEARVAPIRGVARTYSEVARGKPLAYVGSTGRLEVAVRDGNAAQELRLGVGAPILVRRVRP
ncbi:MAG TPA: SAM-dependent chlorinase/fluorinase [Planctomycetota bacterium]|nr:SAM-dependent chlorinase/fluorinase [Planctomycetota bacterium]